MSGFSSPIIGGGGSLVYPQIMSPDFSLAGKTGWAVMKNGTAYFYSVTAEGTITATEFDGTDFIINSAGSFFYAGTPAAGNLIASIAAANGTDQFGNTYFGPGNWSYGSSSIYPAVGLVNGEIILRDSGSVQAVIANSGPGQLEIAITDAVTALLLLDATGSTSLASFNGTLALTTDTAVPATPPAGVVLHSDSGQLNYSSADSNSYDTGRLSAFVTPAQTIPNVGAALTSMVFTVAAGTYRVKAVISFTGPASTAKFQFHGPGESLVFCWSQFLSQGNITSGILTTSFTSLISGTLSATPAQLVIDMLVTFSAAGTFSLQCVPTTSGDNPVIAVGSFLDLMPVT